MAREVHNLVVVEFVAVVVEVVAGAAAERMHCTAEEVVVGLQVQLQNRGLLGNRQTNYKLNWVVVGLLANHKRRWRVLVG